MEIRQPRFTASRKREKPSRASGAGHVLIHITNVFILVFESFYISYPLPILQIPRHGIFAPFLNVDFGTPIELLFRL
jgi:hypothetical protein